LLEETKFRALVDMPQIEKDAVELVTKLGTIVARAGGQKGFFWESSVLAVEDVNASVASMVNGVVNCTTEQEIQYVEGPALYDQERDGCGCQRSRLVG
jgi:hypothetical protein